jgi:hypothetical protein
MPSKSGLKLPRHLTCNQVLVGSCHQGFNSLDHIQEAGYGEKSHLLLEERHADPKTSKFRKAFRGRTCDRCQHRNEERGDPIIKVVANPKWLYLRRQDKTDEARQIPINHDLEEGLKTIRTRQQLTSQYGFPNRQGSFIRDLRTAFRSALTRVGINDFRPHEL